MQLVIPECFDSIEDALKAAVMAMGGFKKVGERMRGADFDGDSQRAADWLRKCLSGERREQLHPAQVMWILREARKVGFHAAMDYFAGNVGYKAAPVDVEEQVKDLQSQIVSGMDSLQRAVAQLSQLQSMAGKASA